MNGRKKVKRSEQLVANVLTAGAMASFLCVSAASAQTPPRFKDYPVRESFTAKTAPLVLSREARMYRTRLKEATRFYKFENHRLVWIRSIPR